MDFKDLWICLITISFFGIVATGAEKAVSLQDMEGKMHIAPWPEDRKLEISTEWAADGKKSLRLFLGTATAFAQNDMKVTDWRPYNVMRMVVNNPTTTAVGFGVEFRDKVEGLTLISRRFGEGRSTSSGLTPRNLFTKRTSSALPSS
jgi:hypothetical protein